ncbi:hypothetical protein QUF72_13995, partial [Desulfobacterales bacterium HSG2]|nr:hypothetical protein [Desulfobacterales bacterium HSG2]
MTGMTVLMTGMTVWMTGMTVFWGRNDSFGSRNDRNDSSGNFIMKALLIFISGFKKILRFRLFT